MCCCGAVLLCCCVAVLVCVCSGVPETPPPPQRGRTRTFTSRPGFSTISREVGIAILPYFATCFRSGYGRGRRTFWPLPFGCLVVHRPEALSWLGWTLAALGRQSCRQANVLGCMGLPATVHQYCFHCARSLRPSCQKTLIPVIEGHHVAILVVLLGACFVPRRSPSKQTLLVAANLYF